MFHISNINSAHNPSTYELNDKQEVYVAIPEQFTLYFCLFPAVNHILLLANSSMLVREMFCFRYISRSAVLNKLLFTGSNKH
jgi:hypothetical protein